MRRERQQVAAGRARGGAAGGRVPGGHGHAVSPATGRPACSCRERPVTHLTVPYRGREFCHVCFALASDPPVAVCTRPGAGWRARPRRTPARGRWPRHGRSSLLLRQAHGRSPEPGAGRAPHADAPLAWRCPVIAELEDRGWGRGGGESSAPQSVTSALGDVGQRRLR